MNKNILTGVGVVLGLVLLVLGVRFVLSPRDSERRTPPPPPSESKGNEETTNIPLPDKYEILVDNNPELRQELADKLRANFSVVLAEIEKDPTVSINWRDLAIIKNTFMDYDGAEQAWLHSVKINEFNGPSYLDLARFYWRTQPDHKKAEEYFKKAINADIQGLYGPAAYRDLSDLYRYDLADKADQVDDILIEGASAYPESSDVRTHLASYYYDMKNYTEALKWYEDALRLRPDNELIKSEIEDIKAKL